MPHPGVVQVGCELAVTVLSIFRGNAGLLSRTAHAADLHPLHDSCILLFGGWGGVPEFLSDLVLIDTVR